MAHQSVLHENPSDRKSHTWSPLSGDAARAKKSAKCLIFHGANSVLIPYEL
jgi:hypothetical protein